MTHRIVVRVSLFLHHCCEPDDGDDGVQHEGEKEVFVECYPLTAQTPEGSGRGDISLAGRICHEGSKLKPSY